MTHRVDASSSERPRDPAVCQTAGPAGVKESPIDGEPRTTLGSESELAELRQRAAKALARRHPKSALALTVNGRPMTCCAYSREVGEELEAGYALARTIRRRIDPDELAAMMVRLLESAHSKRDAKLFASAATMILERLPVRRDLKRALAVHVELARREAKS